jgi:hypothetical protein
MSPSPGIHLDVAVVADQRVQGGLDEHRHVGCFYVAEDLMSSVMLRTPRLARRWAVLRRWWQAWSDRPPPRSSKP